MSQHDLLLAGFPASLKRLRESAQRSAPIAREGRTYRAGEIVDLAMRPKPAGRASLSKVHDASAERTLRAFNTWAFKREQPSDLDLMLQVISHAIACAEPLAFVLYWGKGPRCTLADPDLQCLDFLSSLADRVRQVHAAGAVLNLIFTDTHARLNGHGQPEISKYFAEVGVAARERGFYICWLGELVRALQSSAVAVSVDSTMHDSTLSQLVASARKWYRGSGTPEQGAMTYYRMNLVERHAVEAAFPSSIFVTFNGSELRDLFPPHMPIFYMYSLRRGFSVKPWFLPTDASVCTTTPCSCVDAAAAN